MNLIHHNFKRTIRCIGLLVCFTACEEFIQIDPPKNELTTETVFQSDAVAQAAMRGIYAEIADSAPLGGSIQSITNLQALASDESFYRLTGQDFLEINTNAIVSANNLVYQNWNNLYRIIYFSNSLVEGLSHSVAVSANIKEQLIGEAKFIRAFCYFYLVNLWGDVPVTLTTDYRANRVMVRMAKSEVYDQIIADLKDSRQRLAEDYTYSAGERVRVNRWAATALLARVYLYTGKWAEAESEATTIINQTNLYALCDDLNGVFLKNNQEAIWQLFSTDATQDTREGPLYLPTASASGITNYPLNNHFVDDFESGDSRKAEWIRNKVVGGINYFYPYKYKVRFITAGTPHTEYSVVLRLAEQYLIRAEARAQQNNITGAQDDVNKIRNRAHLSPTQANDKPSLLLAIERERRVEFFNEWGHRWFDLVRTERATGVLGLIKAGWHQHDTLWPIPEVERNRNQALSQNPGY